MILFALIDPAIHYVHAPKNVGAAANSVTQNSGTGSRV